MPQTPRVVEVGRGKETMEVRCTLAAYRPTTELVESKFGGATIGNVLAGGLIGIVIDAASGANMSYPDRVVVLMEPQTFGDEATRDAFFGKHKARIDALARIELQNVTSQCGNQPREFCDADRKKVTDRQAAALADLDRRRLASAAATAGTGNSKQ